MKTYLALLTAVALAACGGGGGSNDGAKSSAATPVTDTPAASTPAATDPAASTPTSTTPTTPTTTPDTPATTPQTPASGTSGTADPSTPASSTDGASAPGAASDPFATACEPGFVTETNSVCYVNGKLAKTYVYAIPKTVLASNAIIKENTTWTAENSPYYVPSGVQVAANATLTIEAGAIVEGPRPWPCTGCTAAIIGSSPITNAGTIKVQGSQSQHAKLYSLGINNAQSGTLSIQYADLYETPLPYSSAGNVVLLDSRIERANVMTNTTTATPNFTANGSPFFGKNGDIERNTFIDSAGFYFDATTTVKNNLFVNMASPLTLNSDDLVFPTPTSPTQPVDAGYSWTPTNVTLNSFVFTADNASSNSLAVTLSTNVGACYLTNMTCPPYSFDMSNNYWGTVDNTVIMSRIADKNSNVSIKGEVKFLPPLETPDRATPSVSTAAAAN
jgi:hypothetical protein